MQFKKNDNAKCYKDVEQSQPHMLEVGMPNGIATSENSLAVF